MLSCAMLVCTFLSMQAWMVSLSLKSSGQPGPGDSTTRSGFDSWMYDSALGPLRSVTTCHPHDKPRIRQVAWTEQVRPMRFYVCMLDLRWCLTSAPVCRR